MEEQQQAEINSGHFCQICERGFASGRALGGHMRIHGTAGSQFHSRPPPVREDWRHKISRVSETNSSGSSASMDEREDFRGDGSGSAYALRPNPKRNRRFADAEYSTLAPPAQPQGCVSKTAGFPLSKNPRVCEECGREFSSWKALVDHGRCRSDPVPEIRSLADHDEYREPVLDSQTGMKGKRSIRGRHRSQYNLEEADTAYCLVMLSAAGRGFWGSGEDPQSATSPKIPIATTELPRGLDKFSRSRSRSRAKPTDPSHDLRSDESTKSAYECKECKRKFDSFQALGGHRASHSKLPRGCSNRKDELHEEENERDASGTQTNPWGGFGKDAVRESSSNEEIDESPAKVHECSICHRIFYSGQALGGHKRCHWLPAGASDTTTTNSTISTSKGSPPRQQPPPGGQLPDLNFPAPFDDDDGCTHVQH